MELDSRSLLLCGLFFAALRLCVNAAARKIYFTQRREGAKTRKENQETPLIQAAYDTRIDFRIITGASDKLRRKKSVI